MLLTRRHPKWHQGNDGGIEGKGWSDYLACTDPLFSFTGGWQFLKYNDATPTVTVENNRLKILFKVEASNDKHELYRRLALASYTKSSVFSTGMKFQIDSFYAGTGLTYCLCHGLFGNAEFNQDAVFFCVENTGKPYLVVYATDTTGYAAAGEEGDMSEDTDYWLRTRSDGTTISATIYGNGSDFISGGIDSGVDCVRYMPFTVADMDTKDFEVNRFGFNSVHHATYTGAETWKIEWMQNDIPYTSFYQ